MFTCGQKTQLHVHLTLQCQERKQVVEHVYIFFFKIKNHCTLLHLIQCISYILCVHKCVCVQIFHGVVLDCTGGSKVE